ncbi:MAG: CBS domain-containing protein [Alphaproteobacteria bacterium]
MKIKEQPNYQTKTKPVTFAPDDRICDALAVMSEKNIGSIVVVNPDQTIAGIVTERDMMIRVLAKGINVDTTALAEIMSTEIHAANENDELIDWLKVMSSERFRHLPIVDNDQKLVNMMSQGDFVAHTWPDLNEKMKNDIKGRLGWSLQIFMVLFGLITLGLIAFKF